MGIFIFLLLRSPCKKLKSYDKPLYGFEQRHQQQQDNNKKINLTKIEAYGVSTKPSAQRRSDQFGEINSADRRARKFPLVPMGVLAPVSAHAGHSAQPPIDASGNFPARCLQSRFHQISPFSGQNRVNWVYRGIPQIYFSFES